MLYDEEGWERPRLPGGFADGQDDAGPVDLYGSPVIPSHCARKAAEMADDVG